MKYTSINSSSNYVHTNRDSESTDVNDINNYTQNKDIFAELDGNQVNMSFTEGYAQNPVDDNENTPDSYQVSIAAQQSGVGYVAMNPKDKEEKEGIERKMDEVEETKVESDGTSVSFSVKSDTSYDNKDMPNQGKKTLVSSRGNSIGPSTENSLDSKLKRW